MVRIGVGQVLRDRWKIEAPLGEGGLATVWAATHRNGDRVAIKALRADFVKNEYIRERFLREARIANRIKHPAVVRVSDDDTLPDGTPIIVMELLVGETLEQRRVRLGGRLQAEEVVGHLVTVLDALEAAHSAGVIHRDLKPDNVFLERDGRLRVLDFGIARVLEGSEFVTHTGTVVGTLEYMPPEQAAGRARDIDARSDVYGVGAMAFKLLSGQPVHRTQNAPEAMLASISRHARSLAEAAPGLPRELVAVVDRALRFESRERWSSATEMRHALAGFAPRASPRILDLAREHMEDGPTQTSDGFDEAVTHRMDDNARFVARNDDAATMMTPPPVPSSARSIPPVPLSVPGSSPGSVPYPRSVAPPPTFRIQQESPLRGSLPIVAGVVLTVLTVIVALLAMRGLR